MSFFKQLLATGLQRVIIDVIKTESKVTVVLTPKTQSTDPSVQAIKPLHISYHSVEEMDHKFFTMITSPMSQTATFFNNISEYEKSLEEAKKAAEEKKSSKTKATAEKKETPAKPKASELNFDVPEDITKESTEEILAEAEKVINELEPNEVVPETDVEEVQAEEAEEIQEEEIQEAVIEEEIPNIPEPEKESDVIQAEQEEEITETPKPKMPSLFA